MAVLKKGDHVGIVATGALFDKEKFKAGVECLKEMGLKPVLGKNIFKKDFIFAGTVKNRVSDFMRFAKDEKIKAIWCVRGGCGTYSVAQELAKFPIPRQPKPVIGMSDVTALHLLLMQKWKWPVLHAPLLDRLGAPDHKGIEREVLRQTLFKPDFSLHIKAALHAYGKKTDVTGILTGGNLAMIATSLGSRWEINTNNKILFLEEVYEAAYRIDRLLVQLESAGKFDKIKALVLGDFSHCVDKDGKERWQMVIKRHFEKARFPVLMGVRSGHGDIRLALPMGLQARVRTSKQPIFEIQGSLWR